MKVSKIYASTIFALILLAHVSVADEFKNGAVIFTGHMFHHEGLQLQQNLLKKGFDVHLVEVKSDPEYGIQITDWKNSTLGQNLQNRYEKLLFIMTGHGNLEWGVNIEWSSVLGLLELLKEKSDNILVHIDTCYSGNQTESFLRVGGDKLKIFTTSSRSGRRTATTPVDFNHSNVIQIFSGYYLHKNGDCNSANIQQFKKLHCNSTADDVFKVLDNVSVNGDDTKIFLHKGKNEKLRDWNILPVNLHVFDEKRNMSFRGTDCLPSPINYSGTRVINFDSVKLVDVVNTYDPISEWILRTVDVKFDKELIFPVPNEVKKNTTDVIPYSSILAINGSECDIQGNKCSLSTGKEMLSHTTELKLGFYTNKNEIWELDHGDFNFIIFLLIACSLGVVLLIIVGIVFKFCCKFGKKIRGPTRNARDPIEVYISSATCSNPTYERPTNAMMV